MSSGGIEKRHCKEIGELSQSIIEKLENGVK